MKIEVSVSAAVEGLTHNWPRMTSADAFAYHPFQGVDHVDTWVSTIGAARNARPLLVEVCVDGQPYLFAAFCIEQRRGVRVLTFLDGGVCDYNAPVLSLSYEGQTPSTRLLYQRIVRALPAFDAIIFEKMPLRIGAFSNPLVGAKAERSAGAHAIPLCGAWNDFERHALHRAKDSRRKRRRLSEAGALRVLIAGDNSEPAPLLAAMMRLKSARYVARDGVDGFDRPGYRAYYKEMTRRHSHAGVHLAALVVGDDILAAHWGLVTADAFYCLMLGYVNDGLGQYSPARLLLEDLIAWSLAKGLTRFDFGGGGAAWKVLLGAQTSELAHYEAAFTATGWAYLQARNLRRHLPPRLVLRRANTAQNTPARSHDAMSE